MQTMFSKMIKYSLMKGESPAAKTWLADETDYSMLKKQPMLDFVSVQYCLSITQNFMTSVTFF